MRHNPEDDGLARIGNTYFMVRSPVGGASHAINPKTKKTYCGHDMVKLWDKWRPMDVLPDDKHQPTCKVCQRHTFKVDDKLLKRIESAYSQSHKDGEEAKLQPLSEKEFQDIMADFAIKKRLSKGKCDENTLTCYRNGARDQAIKDYRFLQSMGLIVLRKFEDGITIEDHTKLKLLSCETWHNAKPKNFCRIKKVDQCRFRTKQGKCSKWKVDEENNIVFMP